MEKNKKRERGRAEALPREQALMAMFEEWGKTPMTTEALMLRDELLDVVSGTDHEALDQYTVLLCREAFVGGFMTALEVLLPDGSERRGV